MPCSCTLLALALHFKSIQAIYDATMDDLVLVDEIGERIAQSLIDFFAVEANIQLIEQLIAAGLQVKIEEDEIEISVEIRLFLANEIFPKAYVKYSECKSESKRNMMKTIEFIRNRLLRIKRKRHLFSRPRLSRPHLRILEATPPQVSSEPPLCCPSNPLSHRA